jgi:LPXTG-motif cell wall-anchored protein
MLRPRPLATVIAALAVLACALLFAPFASTRSGPQTLSPTPPVTLAPPSSTSTSTTTTSTAQPKLPKTGLEIWLVALVGLGLLATGAALRQARGGPASRRPG